MGVSVDSEYAECQNLTIPQTILVRTCLLNKETEKRQKVQGVSQHTATKVNTNISRIYAPSKRQRLLQFSLFP